MVARRYTGNAVTGADLADPSKLAGALMVPKNHAGRCNCSLLLYRVILLSLKQLVINRYDLAVLGLTQKILKQN